MTDRRGFLRYAAATAVSSAALSGGIDVIRTGILGTQHGHLMGKLKAMKNSPDYQVLSICEPDADAAARAKNNPAFEGIRWVSEDEMLSDNSLHLIVVECRPWDALPFGRKVVAAGKHLHLEKPPGNEWAPFKEMVEEARRRNLLFQTGYMWRWHEGINAAIEAKEKGWLGDVFMVRGTINSDRDQRQRDIEAKYKGGSMYELGGHLIDRVVELLGRPKKVNSWLHHDTSIPDKLADNTLAVLEYDRAIVTLSSSARMYGSGEHRSFEVIGSDGTFIVYPETSRMRVAMRKPQGAYRAGWQQIDLPPQPRYIGDFQELARALKSGKPLRHSYDHELTLHETLLRASGEMS
jgi:predicted dehydrogenase